jgi:hypothetical protein
MDSICAACGTMIEEGETIQGQKPEGQPWIVTCYPPCYADQNWMAGAGMGLSQYEDYYYDGVNGYYSGGDSTEEDDDEEEEEGYEEEEEEEDVGDRHASQETVDLEPSGRKHSVTRDDIVTLQSLFDDEDDQTSPQDQRKQHNQSAPATQAEITIVSADATECWV